MRFRHADIVKNGQGVSLDVTPIVDVVFNLLIFFALSLNFAATSGGINVNLPSAKSAKPIKSEDISINMTKDGTLYYNDKVIEYEELADKLKPIEDKSTLVLIRADNTVPHGKVVQVMDIAKSEGFSKLAFAVDHASGPPPAPEEGEEEEKEEAN